MGGISREQDERDKGVYLEIAERDLGVYLESRDKERLECVFR